MNQLQLTPELYQELRTHRNMRMRMARHDHVMFFTLYLAHHAEFPFAQFHHDIFNLTENENEKLLLIITFRNSGKSTIATLSYPIWSIIGKQQRKFVLIITQNQLQARLHMYNLRQELETNELLRADFGAFEADSDQWAIGSLFIPDYQARIVVASSEQSIRGMRNRQFRPDVVICDDIEDTDSVKTKESRDKTFSFLTREIMPMGDKNTKTIIVGNLLHDDSSLMRIKHNVEQGKQDGAVRFIPIVDDQGNPTWPGKFPTKESVEVERRRIGNNSAWSTEFLLHPVPDQERVIHPEWIHYYDNLPPGKYALRAIGIDTAITTKQTGDFTAMVCAEVHGSSKERRIFILPHIVNEHLGFPAQIERAQALSDSLEKAIIYSEGVAYQNALPEQLMREGYFAEAIGIKGQDKRTRLQLVAPYVKNGVVLFPKQGVEILIQQLLGFGYERYDDLVDAFTLLVNKLISEGNKVEPRIRLIGDDDPPAMAAREYIDRGIPW